MAKTKARKRRSLTAEPVVGKDSYVVLDPEGNVLAEKGYQPLALLAAQEHALRSYIEPTTLTVERRSLFGPATTLYRVVRDEDRNVIAYTISSQD